MSFSGRLHSRLVFPRRVSRLIELLPRLIPHASTVLDVGCGDGRIAKLLAVARPDISVHGIDVLVRAETHIPVTAFDGRTIPFPDRSFDVLLLVDVIHHADDGHVLLREAGRVARSRVLIKDHNRDGIFAAPTLRFMDWVGNAHHGVALPYNYWSRDQWRRAFAENGLAQLQHEEALGLYPWPASLLFDRSLHFLAALEPTHAAASAG